MNTLCKLSQCKELEIRTELLLGLSRFFAQGGENLEQTLPSVYESYARWMAHFASDSEDSSTQLNSTSTKNINVHVTFEYNRLFVGPASPLAPPYESVYRSADRLVMQDTTLKVRSWYHKENLRAGNMGNEPDDFIATELEYAAYLLFKAHKLLQEGLLSKSLLYIQNYNLFLEKHLSRWIPEFVETLSSGAQSQLFKDIGKIILQTVTTVEELTSNGVEEGYYETYSSSIY